MRQRDSHTGWKKSKCTSLDPIGPYF